MVGSVSGNNRPIRSLARAPLIHETERFPLFDQNLNFITVSHEKAALNQFKLDWVPGKILSDFVTLLEWSMMAREILTGHLALVIIFPDDSMLIYELKSLTI